MNLSPRFTTFRDLFTDSFQEVGREASVVFLGGAIVVVARKLRYLRHRHSSFGRKDRARVPKGIRRPRAFSHDRLAREIARGIMHCGWDRSLPKQMIARFGRFPHRNTVLGRKCTPAEQRAVAAGNAW